MTIILEATSHNDYDDHDTCITASTTSEQDGCDAIMTAAASTAVDLDDQYLIVWQM